MKQSLINVIIDGFILLVASSCLALVMILFNAALNNNLDGNPLVTTITKAAESGNQSMEDTARKVDSDIEYINSKDHHEATALMMICYVNYNKVGTTMSADTTRLPYINLLIEKGADIHERDKDGWTALCWASWSGLPVICQRLLKLGSDINIADKQGNTPLMMAAIRGNHEVVELYLQNGADRDAKCANDMTALDYAQQEFERISKKTIMILDSNMAENKDIHKQRFEKTVALLSAAGSK